MIGGQSWISETLNKQVNVMGLCFSTNNPNSYANINEAYTKCKSINNNYISYPIYNQYINIYIRIFNLKYINNLIYLKLIQAHLIPGSISEIKI